MTDACKLTKKKTHRDIRYNATLGCIKHNLITVQKLHASKNAADTLNNNLSGTLLHNHSDTPMGNRQHTKKPPTQNTHHITPYR